MASLNDVFPGFGEQSIQTNQRIQLNNNTRQGLMCPVCSEMAIRSDIHLGMKTCPIGHQWYENENGQKNTRQGMFFERPSKPSEKPDMRQFVKQPNMNPAQLPDNPYHDAAQHAVEYQEMIRTQFHNLGRPRSDFF